jgi:photosynthetic reaction center H subunit
MGTGAITQSVDVAQLVLYLFWIFFAGLIYYLVRENHREGYPMDVDGPADRPLVTGWPIPAPKTYLLPHGGESVVPTGAADPHTYRAEPAHGYIGAPLVPLGDPMTAEVGPGAYARRADVPDLDPEGHPKIVPLRHAAAFGVSMKDVDPRGLPVIGADGEIGGRVRDLWVDRVEYLFRYIEVETSGASGPRIVLLPWTFARVKRDGVHVAAVLGRQFAGAPAPLREDRVTLLEEERICAYYAAGTLYAEPGRAEPLF